MFFDWDGNGRLEQHTVMDAIHKLQLPETNDLDKLLQDDALELRNKSDGMDFDEFVERYIVATGQSLAVHRSLQLAFRQFDADGNGRLTLEELRTAVEVDAVDVHGKRVGFTEKELEALYTELLAAEGMRAPVSQCERKPYEKGVGPEQFAAFVMAAFAARFIKVG
eukprot:SAG31_NODE_1320_length_8809_cov_4.243398_2_plen_166_part_00